MDLGGVDGVDVVLGRLEAAPLGRRRKVHRIDLSKGSDEIRTFFLYSFEDLKKIHSRKGGPDGVLLDLLRLLSLRFELLLTLHHLLLVNL